MTKFHSQARAFHKHTKLAMFASLPTITIYLQFSFLFVPTDVIKYEIRNQGVYEVYISRLNALLDQLVFNGRAKTNLAFCIAETYEKLFSSVRVICH